MDERKYDRERKRSVRKPDGPCIRCGHSMRASLSVVGKNLAGAKVNLCRNCKKELDSSVYFCLNR